MQLYEYQKNVLEACKADPSHSQLISMPTGTGKTITFLSLAKNLGKKTLIIVHREELLKQTYEKAKICGFAEEEISLVMAEKKEKSKLLTIAMVQTLARNLEKYLPEDIEAIIIDEAHHATADSYKKVIAHFRIFEEKKPLFGFTATPLRGDKDHLNSIFLSHSFKMTLSEATRMGYIVPVHGLRIEMNKVLADIETKQGDYDPIQLEKIMNCDSVNSVVVERCKNLRNTPAIIFTTSVNHAEELSRRLRHEKRKAISVSYRTPKKTLARIFNMLAQGKIDFITNAVKLSEGFDHPAIQAIIMARPTRSPVLYKQMIGRGLRNFKGKYDCFVMEFTSNDPKMMKWEDIDENATFQASSLKQKKTEKEAFDHYKQILGSKNIEVLDVRQSYFEFYECRVRKLYKYKKSFLYLPIDNGFVFFEFLPSHNKFERQSGHYFNLFGTVCIWKEPYQSFYIWDEPSYCMTEKNTQPFEIIYKMALQYCQINRMGRWYPSDLEPIQRKQKILLQNKCKGWVSIKTARKAEMELEEIAIKKAIDLHLSKNNFSGVLCI